MTLNDTVFQNINTGSQVKFLVFIQLCITTRWPLRQSDKWGRTEGKAMNEQGKVRSCRKTKKHMQSAKDTQRARECHQLKKEIQGNIVNGCRTKETYYSQLWQGKMIENWTLPKSLLGVLIKNEGNEKLETLHNPIKRGLTTIYVWLCIFHSTVLFIVLRSTWWCHRQHKAWVVRSLDSAHLTILAE